MTTVRALIAKPRVAEMLARGWIIIDLMPGDDAEYSTLMEEPEPEPRAPLHIGEAAAAVVSAAAGRRWECRP